jgi:hypothetical protein
MFKVGTPSRSCSVKDEKRPMRASCSRNVGVVIERDEDKISFGE